MEISKTSSEYPKTKKILSDAVPVIILILYNIFFFIKIILAKTSLYGGDVIYQFYPWKKFIFQHILNNGFLPFWNPYLFSGAPFITNIQASMFYPPGFLYYLFPPETAYLYSTLMHCLLGTIFMYLFMRSISVSMIGSLISAVIFIFNGYFIGHLYAGHLSFIQSYIWLPLIFLFLFRFYQYSDLKDAVIAGLILGIEILGGFPQISFYTMLAGIAFGIFILWNQVWSGSSKKAPKTLSGLSIIFIIGFALAAIQILPTLEFTGLSTRAGGVNYEFATYDSLHPKELLTFFIPEIFGNVVDDTYWLTPERWHFWETCAYVGVVPFFLFLCKPISNNLKKLWFFFAILIFLSLLLALGKYNPVYPLIYKLPGFHSFRIPAQIIYLYVFSMAVLSGIGITGIESGGKLFTKYSILFLATAGMILVIFLVCVHWMPSGFFQWMFTSFADGPIRNMDFFNIYERTVTGLNKAGLIFFAILLLFFLRKNKKITLMVFSLCLFMFVLMDLGEFGWRFIKPYDYSIAPNGQYIKAGLNNKPFLGRVVALSPFNPNDGLIYEFPSVLGYDPLILGKYVRYIETSQGWPLNDNVVNLHRIDQADVKLLKMLNVNRIVNSVKDQELENNIPYINFVANPVFKNEDESLSFIQSDEFEPETMVVLNSAHLPTIPYDKGEGNIKGSYSVLDYDTDRIRLNVTVDKPSYLVFSEIYYPGWKAKVDGNITPVLCGNYIFRVIRVSAGEHEVYLYFVSWPFRLGLLISLIALTGSIGYFLYRKIY